MKTQISIEAINEHGIRAIITVETDTNWMGFAANVDVSNFKPVDIRRVRFSTNRGLSEWLNSGELVGWK